MVRFGRGFPMMSALPQQQLPPIPRRPIAFDAVSAFNNSGASGSPTLTWTQNISGTAALAWVGVINYGAAAPVPTVKIGSTSMNLLGSISWSSQHIYSSNTYNLVWCAFGLLNPPTGSQTFSAGGISGLYSATGQIFAASTSYFNVGSFGTFQSTTGSTASLSHTVTAAPGQLVAQGFFEAYAGATGPFFSAYNQTSRLNNAGTGGFWMVVGDAPGVASVPFTATAADANTWVSAAVPLNP